MELKPTKHIVVNYNFTDTREQIRYGERPKAITKKGPY